VDVGADTSRLIGALESAIMTLRDEMAAVRTDLERERGRSDRAEAETTALRVQLEQARAVAADTAQTAGRVQEARQTEGLLARLRRALVNRR
jgi:hypothetical protein